MAVPLAVASTTGQPLFLIAQASNSPSLSRERERVHPLNHLLPLSLVRAAAITHRRAVKYNGQDNDSVIYPRLATAFVREQQIRPSAGTREQASARSP